MSIFTEGNPHALIQPMHERGYGIQPAMVDQDFAAAMLAELKENDMYTETNAIRGTGPDARHFPDVLGKLWKLRKLGEYLTVLNDTIIDVSGFDHSHLTYLTVRACPAGDEMSTRIHRNDTAAGPWLITLTVQGSGSVYIYPDDVIDQYGQEIELTGIPSIDPIPDATSPMRVGDAWGAYSMNWSAPHAGGRNTGGNIPKVLILLYGWYDREAYTRHALGLSNVATQRGHHGQLHMPHGIFL